jgi:hypothetical protein
MWSVLNLSDLLQDLLSSLNAVFFFRNTFLGRGKMKNGHLDHMDRL